MLRKGWLCPVGLGNGLGYGPAGAVWISAAIASKKQSGLKWLQLIEVWGKCDELFSPSWLTVMAGMMNNRSGN